MNMPNQYTYKGYDEEIMWPDAIEQPLYAGRKNLKLVPTHKAIVDQNDNSLISIVSEGYNLVRHEDILVHAEEAFAKLGWGIPQREITVIKEGARVIARYGFPEMAFSMRGADDIFPQINMKNSYDLSWVQSLLAGIYRLVCSNGAYVGEMTNKMEKRHIYGADGFDIDFFKSAIDIGISNVEATKIAFHNWQDTKLKQEHLKGIEFLKLNKTENTMLSEVKEKSSGLTLDLTQTGEQEDGTPVFEWKSPGVGESNVYEFYNLMTQFTSHNIQSAMKKEHYTEKVRDMFYSGKILQLAA